MKSIMENKGAFQPPMPVETSTTSLFSGQTKVTLRVDLATGVKSEKVSWPQGLCSSLSGTCIDLDATPPKKARKVTADEPKVKKEMPCQTNKPINHGIIDLLCEDEASAPLPNPPLEIEGMEYMEEEFEDVFNHGGLDH